MRRWDLRGWDDRDISLGHFIRNIKTWKKKKNKILDLVFKINF
jgi:hypothetical protein